MEEQDRKTRKNDKAIAIKKPIIDKEWARVSILNPIALLIGTWKFTPTNKGELVVKCYFVKKQLAWEVLINGSREKIEIEWSNIVGIQPSFKENEPGVLDLELSQPPKFYKERGNIDVRVHDKWVDGSDFTQGQASKCRRHFLVFPPGMLKKHFEKLISCDERLRELCQKPYPTNKNRYFHSNTFISAAALPSLPLPTQQQIQPSNQILQLPYSPLNLIPHTPGMGLATFGSATRDLNVQANSSSIGGGHIGCSNDNLMNMGTVSNGCFSNYRPINWVPRDCSNGVSNDCLMLNTGPTNFNGVSGDYFLNNWVSDSNAHLDHNNSTYFHGVPNSNYHSNWPTDPHGVWLPPRQETQEQAKDPNV